MADYVNDVQKLYVAYFSRPADAKGLEFWTGVLSADAVTGMQQISAAFSTSAEYRATYANMDNRAVVDAVYHNLFGRAGEAAGIDFWVNALNNNTITIDNVVSQVAAGAQNDDKVVFNGRVAVARTFTEHLDLASEQAAYQGTAANAIAKGFIGSIVDLQSAASAIDPGVIDAKIAEIVGTPTSAAHDLIV